MLTARPAESEHPGAEINRYTVKATMSTKRAFHKHCCYESRGY
ncbi:hypothetical protein QO000_001968 [Alkalihalobacillus hemicentroti]|uniref:Uncharacterized protein n=1 Tax=Guptibacillus hwajinpoensis TaxID=208199 RepID=A0ABU0K3E5_9BACL|nr:hypothetical protein [Alkalihalobacillus hemicentroti]